MTRVLLTIIFIPVPTFGQNDFDRGLSDYIILGRVMEKVTGMSFYELLAFMC